MSKEWNATVLANRKRRERIATAAMQGILANGLDSGVTCDSQLAEWSVAAADALIAELDKEE